MTKTFKGKVVLITGGSRGLGANMAEAFANYGADVAISYVSSGDKAQAVVEKLKAKGVRALAIQSDQSDLSSAKPLIQSERAVSEANAIQGKSHAETVTKNQNTQVKGE